MTPEPTPVFRVERDCVVVPVAGLPSGLRLYHAAQFRAQADVYGAEGRTDLIHALNAAELALSDPTRSTIAGE